MSFYKENSFGPSNDIEINNSFENGDNLSFEDQNDNIVSSNLIPYVENNNESLIYLEPENFNMMSEKNNINEINTQSFKSPNLEVPIDFLDQDDHFNNDDFKNNIDKKIEQNSKNKNNLDNFRQIVKSKNFNCIKQNYFLDHIRYVMTNFFDILKSKLDMLKYKSFFKLKELLKIKRVNHLKAQIIFEKFKNQMGGLIKIRSKFNFLKLSKFFFKWRDYVDYRNKYNKIKSEMEEGIEKKYEKDIKSLEIKIKEKDNENKEIKKSINKNGDIESNVLKTISEFEEKEKNYMKNLKKLEEEKKSIQEEIDFILSENNKSSSIINSINYSIINYNNAQGSLVNFSNEDEQKIISENNNIQNGNSINYKKDYLIKLKEKIKEYESQIISLKKENNEKDVKINVFMKEMSELLQSHEKNIEFSLNSANANTLLYSNYRNMDISVEENKFNNYSQHVARPSLKTNSNPGLSNKLLYSSNPSNNSNNLMNAGNIINNLTNQPNSVRNNNSKNQSTKIVYFPNYNNSNNQNLVGDYQNNSNFSSAFGNSSTKVVTNKNSLNNHNKQNLINRNSLQKNNGNNNFNLTNNNISNSQNMNGNLHNLYGNFNINQNNIENNVVYNARTFKK